MLLSENWCSRSWHHLGHFTALNYCLLLNRPRRVLVMINRVCPLSFLHHPRSSRSTTTCVFASRARTTWSASRCCASTARPPSSPHPPSSSGPSTPLQGCAAAARSDSQAITARRRSTCATPTPAWTAACAPAKKGGTPVSAARTTPVSLKGTVVWRDRAFASETLRWGKLCKNFGRFYIYSRF